MIKRNQSFLYVIIVLLLAGLVAYYYMASHKTEVTPAEAKENRKRGLYDYIVDVRTDKEWVQEHVEGTIHIPIGELVTELPTKIPNRQARILFICKKGIRASAVVVIAHKLGYTNVQSMSGAYKELL
jgi:rhodanese-related sulfurtransferase